MFVTLLNSWEYLYRKTKSDVVTCDYNDNRNWSGESRTLLKLSGQIFSNSKKTRQKSSLWLLNQCKCPHNILPSYLTRVPSSMISLIYILCPFDETFLEFMDSAQSTITSICVPSVSLPIFLFFTYIRTWTLRSFTQQHYLIGFEQFQTIKERGGFCLLVTCFVVFFSFIILSQQHYITIFISKSSSSSVNLEGNGWWVLFRLE